MHQTTQGFLHPLTCLASPRRSATFSFFKQPVTIGLVADCKTQKHSSVIARDQVGGQEEYATHTSPLRIKLHSSAATFRTPLFLSCTRKLNPFRRPPVQQECAATIYCHREDEPLSNRPKPESNYHPSELALAMTCCSPRLWRSGRQMRRARSCTVEANSKGVVYEESRSHAHCAKAECGERPVDDVVL